ncbi:MAG TPA: hypothetical protein VMF30_13415 [Pirellulales bacterium]|nr:hypothetical protein [Pirellulales bacterium]
MEKPEKVRQSLAVAWSEDRKASIVSSFMAVYPSIYQSRDDEYQECRQETYATAGTTARSQPESRPKSLAKVIVGRRLAQRVPLPAAAHHERPDREDHVQYAPILCLKAPLT